MASTRVEKMMDGAIVHEIRDYVQELTGGNCTFVDEDLKLLAGLAKAAIAHGLHQEVCHPGMVEKIDANKAGWGDK